MLQQFQGVKVTTQVADLRQNRQTRGKHILLLMYNTPALKKT